MCHGRLPICATMVPYHLTPCQPTSNNMFINSKPERVGRVYILTQEYRHKKRNRSPVAFFVIKQCQVCNCCICSEIALAAVALLPLFWEFIKAAHTSSQTYL